MRARMPLAAVLAVAICVAEAPPDAAPSTATSPSARTLLESSRRPIRLLASFGGAVVGAAVGLSVGGGVGNLVAPYSGAPAVLGALLGVPSLALGAILVGDALGGRGDHLGTFLAAAAGTVLAVPTAYLAFGVLRIGDPFLAVATIVAVSLIPFATTLAIYEVTSARADLREERKNEPVSRGRRILAELGGGLGGAIVGLAATIPLGCALDSTRLGKPNCLSAEGQIVFRLAPVGLLIGAMFGTAAAGHLAGGDGSLAWTAVGTGLGAALFVPAFFFNAAAVRSFDPLLRALGPLAIFLSVPAPFVGGVLGYELSHNAARRVQLSPTIAITKDSIGAGVVARF